MNVLLIGAYERDNFGDLLFLEVIKHYARGLNLVPSSFIESSTASLNGEVIYPYSLLLQQFTWDAIWVVGGEVGGVSVDNALEMSLDDNCRSMIHGSNNIKSATKRAFFASDAYAYLPSKTNYDNNKESLYVITSAGGLSSLIRNKQKYNKKIPVDFRASDTFTHTRDIKSFDALHKFGARNLGLRPDIVHTVSKVFDFEKKNDKPYMAIQASEKLLSSIDMDALVSQISNFARNNDFDIKFFAAGTASGHDNLDLYEELKERIIKHDQDINVFVDSQRNPKKITELIANSNIILASSLHARIVASSYNIPRVSFSKDKVTSYVERWDSIYPYDISVNEVDLSLRKSLEVNKTIAKDKSKELTDDAEDSLKDVLSWLKKNNKNRASNLKEISIIKKLHTENIAIKKLLLKELSAANKNVEEKNNNLNSLQRKKVQLESEINRLRTWPSVRVEKYVRRLLRPVKNKILR